MRSINFACMSSSASPSHQRMLARGLVLLATVCAATLSPRDAHAQVTWSGTGANTSWSTTGNWSSLLSNNFNSALVFAGSSGLTNSNDLTSGTATSITFNSGAGAFVIGGNAVTISSGGSITNNSSNLQTLNMNLSLPGNTTVTTNGSGGNVTLGGANSGAGGLVKAGAGLLTLTGSNILTGFTVSSGSLRNTTWMEVSSGGSGIFVTSGTLENTGRIAQRVQLQINGANAALINSGTVSQGSYGPAYILNGGSVTNSGVWFSAGLAIGAGAADNAYQLSTFTNNAGGSVSYGGDGFGVGSSKFGLFTNAGGTLTIGTNINIGRNSTATTVAGTSALVLTGGTVTSSGTLNLNITGTTMSNVTAAVDLNGGVLATSRPITSTISAGSGTNNVTRVSFGGGALRGTANNVTLLGTDLTSVVVNAGGGTIDLGTGITNTIAASMSGAGGLTKTGSGTLMLTGSNNTYAGTTTVSSGTLQIGDGSTLAGSLPGNVTLSNTSSVVFASTVNQAYAGVISGTGTLTKSGAGSTLTLSGNGSIIQNGLTVSSGTLLNTGSVAIAGVTVGGNATLANQGIVSATGDVFIVTAGGVLVNSGTFSESGYRNLILRSTVSATNSGQMSFGGFFLGGGAAAGLEVATFTNNAGGSLTTGDTIIGQANFATFTNAGGAYTVGSGLGIGRSAGATATGTTAFNVTSGTVTAGGGGAINLGIGTGVSNATAEINLNGGLFIAQRGITASVATGTAGSNNAARVNFAGGTLRGTLNNATLLGTDLTSVSLGVGGGTIDLGSGITNTVAASMSGVGSLTKTGSGTLILTGAGNTYAGNTTVSGGTLQIGDGSTLAGSLPGNVLLTNTTALTFASTANQSYAGLISGTGSITKSGNGSTLTLSGVGSSLAGGLTVSGSSTVLNSGSITVAGFFVNNDGGVLNNQGQLTITNNSTIDNTTAAFVNTGTIGQTGYQAVSFHRTSSGSNAGVINIGMLSVGSYNGTAAEVATFVNTGTITVGDLLAGKGRYGTITNSGGVITATGQVSVGREENAATSLSGTSTLVVASGTVNAAGLFRIGGYGSASNTAGVVNLNGGVLATSVAMAQAASSGTNNTSYVNFGGGTLRGTANGVTLLGTDLTSVSLNSGGGTIDLGSAITNTISANMGGVGGLTKTGAGILVLSGSNGFSGLTTVSAGAVNFGSVTALQNTSGVNIAGGGSLRYTGGATSFDRNISVTSGTGTVTNSGGGVLTLAGTLTKNGTVLRLTGGQFNVTGQIVGASANSDLLVDGTSTVTLSSTNTYNGPTFVNQASNLIVGVNNAIPSNSVVTLGNATTTGTLTLGSNSDSIGGLAFGSAGGTLRVTANSPSSAQLSSSAGTFSLANGTLDLTGSGTSAGYYRLLSAQSITGAFSGTTGLNPAYTLVTTGSTIDLQQRAVLGGITVTNPAAAIITGGTAAFTYTVANSALSGGASMTFTGSGLTNVAGSSSGSSSAAGTSSSVSGLSFTGTSVGAGRTGTFTVSAPSAYGTTSGTGTVTVDVYDHASGSATGTTIALADSIVGYTGSLFGVTSATISNASGYRVNLLTTGGTSAGFVNINNVSGIAAGNSASISAIANLDGSQAIGSNSIGQNFNLAYADDSVLLGASNSLGSQAITVTGNVLDHALPGFVVSGSTLSGTVLDINFGTVDENDGTQYFAYSLANLFNAAYGTSLTAGLDLVSFTAASGGFDSGLIAFNNLAAGTSSPFSFAFTPNGQGSFSKAFTLQFSDNRNLAGASNLRNLTINAQVIVVPEPGTLALAGIGVGLAGWACWKRRRR